MFFFLGSRKKIALSKNVAETCKTLLLLLCLPPESQKQERNDLRLRLLSRLHPHQTVEPVQVCSKPIYVDIFFYKNMGHSGEYVQIVQIRQVQQIRRICLATDRYDMLWLPLRYYYSCTAAISAPTDQ